MTPRAAVPLLITQETPSAEEARQRAICYAEALVTRYEQELLATPADTELHLARRGIRLRLIADWRQRITAMSGLHPESTRQALSSRIDSSTRVETRTDKRADHRSAA